MMHIIIKNHYEKSALEAEKAERCHKLPQFALGKDHDPAPCRPWTPKATMEFRVTSLATC
jgi:hypothetical protein